MAAIDTTYQLQPGESIAAYTSRIAAYNASPTNPNGANPNAAADQAGVAQAYQALPASAKPPVTTVSPGYAQPPTVTPTPTTVTPPSGTTTPTIPAGTAPTVADQFNTSLATTLATQQANLAASLKAQSDSYQTKIDALNQQNSDLQTSQDMGMSELNSTVQQETQAKQAALETEQQQFQQNYDARQALIGQLTTLLSTGQSIIEQMKQTTGLSSIMTPRISQTMADVQGQAGVITAALAAYDTQIGIAQNQLKSATDAIISIYGDQISYWQTVVDFYAGQEKDNTAQIASLSADQKTYIDAQISTLQDSIANTQKTATAIQAAMLDPTTALTYAKAGVSLTDSPDQISQKLAMQAQADANAKQTATGTKPAPATTGSTGYPKGTMANSQYVELSLQRAGMSYAAALAAVPKGKVGVVDNASGQIGYIDPTEYTSKAYTYL